jgi:hypothetical protein
MTGVRFLGILFPEGDSAFLTAGLPSRPRAARTLPGFPCSARMRYDRGGCLLYSGAMVSSRSALGLRPAPAVSQRLALSSASCIPPAEVTITKHAEIHLHSPVRSSPRPPSLDGTATASAFTLGFAPRGYPRRTPRRGRPAWTLDRVTSSTMEPPNNVTTHSVRLHVAPHRS